MIGQGIIAKIGTNAIANVTSVGGIEVSRETTNRTTYASAGYNEIGSGMKDGGEVTIGGLFSGHDYLDMNWKDEPFAPNGKDKYIWKPDFSEFIGEFGVNPAVDEFCKENNYKLNLTNEWFGTWFFIK